MDRQAGADSFEKEAIPWQCPECGGTLRPVDSSLKLFSDSSADSTKYGVRHRFSLFCLCTHQICRTAVNICGFANTLKGNGHEFYPKYIDPPPQFFRIPEGCPAAVRSEILASFTQFWLDLDACANHLRSSLELMLDHRGIRKTFDDPDGKRKPLHLHSRIQMFTREASRGMNKVKREKIRSIGEALLAVKWVGNRGSHSSSKTLTKKDILDAYEILEDVLQQLFSTRKAKREANVRRINRKKGP